MLKGRETSGVEIWRFAYLIALILLVMTSWQSWQSRVRSSSVMSGP